MLQAPLFRLIAIVGVIAIGLVFGIGRFGQVKDLFDSGGATKDTHSYSKTNLAKFKAGLEKRGVSRLHTLDIRAQGVQFTPAGAGLGYPVSRIHADVPQKLIAGIVRQNGGGTFYPSIISLEADSISGRLGWSVHGTVNGAGVGYDARPDGSRLVRIGSAADRQDAIPPAARRAMRQSRCVSRAAGDPGKISRCLR